MKFLILLLIGGLLACSQTGEDKTIGIIAKPDCPHPLVVLPDNFIIDLAADSVVELNPARQQFALFCSVEEAREALAADIAEKRIDGEGRWRVYSLNGTYEELARPCGNGQACLGTTATVLEWVD